MSINDVYHCFTKQTQKRILLVTLRCLNFAGINVWYFCGLAKKRKNLYRTLEFFDPVPFLRANPSTKTGKWKSQTRADMDLDTDTDSDTDTDTDSDSDTDTDTDSDSDTNTAK